MNGAVSTAHEKFSRVRLSARGVLSLTRVLPRVGMARRCYTQDAGPASDLHSRHPHVGRHLNPAEQPAYGHGQVSVGNVAEQLYVLTREYSLLKGEWVYPW